MHHANWIGGSWEAALQGSEFEVSIDGRWPRSGVEDVAAALSAARAAAAGWGGLSFDERADYLEEVLDLWEDDPGLEERLAELLRIGDGDLAQTRVRALEAGDALIEAAEAREPATPARETVLVRAPAAELGGGLVEAVFPPLLDGRPVLLLSDSDLPRLAAGLAELFAEAGVPPGVLSLIHDDRSTCLRAALHSGELGQVRFGGTAEELTEVTRLSDPKVVSRRAEVRLTPFGAGVVELAPPELLLHTPQNITLSVDSAEDPEEAAERVCERAFGPVRVLSGQRAGQVGRVLCDERLFSRFTEALLARVAELEPPCALFDGSLVGYTEKLCRLGLDEGATLIQGGLDAFGLRSRSGRGDVPVPSIFTNVEPQMQLATASRPAPVLSLVRVAGG